MTLIPEYIMHIARECWATLPKDGRGIDHIARAILASIRTEGKTGAPSAKDALHAIANLTTPKSLEQMSGHEDAYRAVERLFAAPPEIEANPAPSSHLDVEDVREQKLATIVAPDNGTPDEVLSYILECAKAWVPEARIIGNARAGDIARAIEALPSPQKQMLRSVQSSPAGLNVVEDGSETNSDVSREQHHRQTANSVSQASVLLDDTPAVIRLSNSQVPFGAARYFHEPPNSDLHKELHVAHQLVATAQPFPKPSSHLIADPDYCFDPDDWEFTCHWADRDEVHGHGDALKLGDPMRVCTLIKGPDKWVADVPIEWDDEGDVLETEIKWFDTEAEARAALTTEGK